MRKIIKNYLQNNHNSLKSKISGAKGRSSLLFSSLKQFIPENKNKPYQSQRYSGLKKLGNNQFLEAQEVLKTAIKKDLDEAIQLCVEAESWNDTRNPFSICIDGTKTGRHYGKQIPGLKQIYDYVNKCKMNTHEVYILLISHGEKEFVVDFEICESNHSPHEIAKKMLEDFLNLVPNEVRKRLKQRARLSFDGAWGTGDFLIYLNSQGWKRCAIKSAGKDLVQVEGQEEPIRLAEYEYETIQYLNKHPSKWQSFNKRYQLDDIQFHAKTLYLPNLDFEIKAVLYKFSSKKTGKERYLLLVCPTWENWHPYQMLKCYRARWPIETMIRTSKQVFKFMKTSQHSKKKVKNPNSGDPKELTEQEYDIAQMAAFRRLQLEMVPKFLGYMFVNWYRVQHTRRSKTPLKEVLARIRRFFEELPSSELPDLFAGKRE